MKESIAYTLINILGSLLPIIGLVAIIHFKGFEFPELIDIIGNGELTIICLSLAISTVYTLYTYKMDVGSSRTVDIFFWCTILFIFIGTAIYSLELQNVYNFNSLHKDDIEIAEKLIDTQDLSNTSIDSIDEKPSSIIEKSKSRIVNFSIIFLVWMVVAMLISKLFENRSISLANSRKDDLRGLEGKIFK